MSDLEASVPTRLPVRRKIEDLIERLAAAEGPLLSLYLDVHADTDPNAPAQRADAALRELPLERDVREALETRLASTLRDVAEGTLAFFASADADEPVEMHLLRIAPPLPGGAKLAAAHWGDPWIAPLELLLASEAPIVAVFADERRARVFVHDLGEVAEAAAYVRALDPSGWRRYQEAETGMPGTPARGGAGKDDFEARKEAWTERFVSSVLAQVESAVATRDRARLMLLGETRRRNQLEDELPAPLQDALLASTTVPVDPDLEASRWREPLAERIAEALRSEEEAMLDRLARDGVAGAGAVLDALQQGTLAWLAVPVHVDMDVVHCIGTHWLAEDEATARRVCPDGPIERAPLKRFLVDASRRGRAELRILRGPAAEDLMARIGPIAGLPRRS